MPPNYGERYTQEFAAVYPALAQRLKCALAPFLLEGVVGHATRRDYVQDDNLHPTAAAQPLILAGPGAHRLALRGRDGRAVDQILFTVR